MMNRELIEDGVKRIIAGIGEDPGREGLIDTPRRAAEMIMECLSYTGISNDDIANKYSKCFEFNNSGTELVVARDIPASSWCEHHIALMYDMRVTIAYRPVDRVIGLSKLPRIVNAVTHKLQLQERIGEDIGYIVKKITNCKGIVVIIHSKHGCVSTRGVRSDMITRTIYRDGDDIDMKEIE